MKYPDASEVEIDLAMEESWKAFRHYRKTSRKHRAAFLRAIAKELQFISSELIQIAASETNLDEARLKVEFKRTVFQLTSYADACEEGSWMDVRIHKSNQSPSTEFRKMMIPLGPVVVFGASNFPFAYSTAGGDTACALAAGCTVVIKAHPAHAETSVMVAKAINKAATSLDLPAGVFTHLHGTSFETGKSLVLHPRTKAVGFTGSFEGGRALFDLANQREIPIPVFAEMGSVNPAFFLPEKLKSETEAIAEMYVQSITLSAGQFCTNPGILVAIQGDALNLFKDLIAEKIYTVVPVKMLHEGIAKNFHEKRSRILKEEGILLRAETNSPASALESIPTIAEVRAGAFLKNKNLHKEIFGPFSLLVVCDDNAQMLEVAEAIEGQLTCTLMATTEELKNHSELVDVLEEKCGRFILNGVPTGVEVSIAMHHGGPYPATTDSRFTAVGADGIRRFVRPICFQNWNEDQLPPGLREY